MAKTDLLEEEKQLEESVFRLFIQLNESEPGIMVSRKQIDKLLDNKVLGEKSHDYSSKIDKAFTKYQDQNFLNFAAFQQFMNDLGLTQQADHIEEQFYKKTFSSYCCTKILCCCCYSLCRKQRIKSISKKKIVYDKMQKCETLKVETTLLGALLSIQGGYSQLIDLYTDIAVLVTIYRFSMLEKNQKFKADYLTALIICFASIASTFLAQQGSLIAIKFSRGDFEPQNFKSKNCLVKFLQIALLTCFGAIIIVIFEIIDQLRKIFTLPAFLIFGSNGVQKVDQLFENAKSWVSSLNHYQLISMEQQRQVCGILFENLPYTLLLFIIKMRLLECGDLLEGKAASTINISLIMTFIIIIQVIITAWMEASSLKESATGYLMSKMTANNKWIPFMHLIVKRDCQINIHFGQVDLNVPFLTKVLGIYPTISFEFSDWTLNYLLDELILWSSELNGQKMETRYNLIITPDSLNKVSLNMIVHFVQNAPQDVFDIDLLLDWKVLIQKQQDLKLIKYTYNKNTKVERAFSPKGVSLLNLCILNEKTSEDWPLLDVFHFILDSGKYALQDEGVNDPLVVAIQNNCYKSLDILYEANPDFHVQLTDSSGTSVIGYQFAKLFQLDSQVSDSMINQQENSDELKEMRIYTNSLLENKIDIHLKQFTNIGVTKKSVSAWQIIFKSLRHHRMIRFGINKLLEIVKNEQNFELEEYEKNTLFKNAAKLLQNYTGSDGPVVKQLGELSRLCKVNIFTYKDKNGKGIAHRLIQNWSQEIRDNRILSIFCPYDDQADSNLLSQIFKEAEITESLYDMFESSWQQSIVIINADQNNCKDIQNLKPNKQQLRKIDLQLKLCKSSPQNRYNEFLQLIQTIVEDYVPEDERIKDDGEQKANLAEMMLKTQKSLIRGIKKIATAEKDNQFIHTKRFKPHGKFKRFVGQQSQGVLELDLLTKEQLDDLGEINEQQLKRTKIMGAIMRGSMETCLEWIAAADLYTDLVVLVQLAQTVHKAWTTITVFSMIAPFLACQIPFLIFLKEKISRDKSGKKKLHILGVIMLSPLMLIYMTLMDLVFLFLQAFVFPILSLLKLLTCGYVDLTFVIDKLDGVYEIMFEMQKLDVAGFRRMRTIAQLTFETYLQLVLQIRMLFYFGGGSDDLGVSVSAIAISVVLSTSHAIIEGFFLYMEAQASRTSFINYCIICFNGRFGWVPYNDHLMRSQQQDDKKSNDGKNEQDKIFKQVDLNYENISSHVLCFDMQVEFTFTNETLLSLSKTLSSFPYVRNPKEIPIIRLGQTIDQVSLRTLQGFIKVCQQRVKIDLQGTNLVTIFKNSPQKELLNYTAIDQISTDDINYMYSMIEGRQTKLLKFIFSQNDMLIKIRYPQRDMTLPNMVYHDRDAEFLELLFSLDSQVFQDQLLNWEQPKNQIKKEQYIMQLFNSLDMNLWTVMATNSTVFSSIWDSMNYVHFEAIQDRDPSLFYRSLKFWHSRYGPQLPPELISDQNYYAANKGNDFMQSLAYMYPQTIYVRVNHQFTSVNTKAAYCFALVRKKIVDAWQITSNGPKIDQNQSEGTKKNPLNIAEFGISLSDFKILTMLLTDDDHKQVLSLTDEDVQRLDKATEILKMDSYKWLYIGRTRLNDQTGNQIECTYHGRDGRSSCAIQERGIPLPVDFPYEYKFATCNWNEVEAFDPVLEVKIPENCSFYTQFEFKQTDPKQKSYVNPQTFTKNARYSLWMYHYRQTNKTYCYAKPLELAEFNTAERVSKIWSAKPIFLLDSQQKGCSIRFDSNSGGDDYALLIDPKFTFIYDFPGGTDIKQEQIKLEKACAESYRNWEESPKYEPGLQHKR